MFPYEYMSDFEKFKEELPSKGKFYRSADELVTKNVKCC